MQSTVAIVGGGNSAHILVNLLTSHKIKTILITRRPNEWNTNGITMTYGSSEEKTHDIYPGDKFHVTNDYKLINSADIIFLCCPVNIQITLLFKIKPYIKRTALIGTVFGQARFDKMVEYVMHNKQPTFAFIQIPWICRATKYGESVDNLGDQNVDLAYRNVSKSDMEWWVNIMHTDKSKHISYVTFMREFFFPSNIIIHPGILYGRYLVQANTEYFYNNLSPIAGASIEQLDIERLNVIYVLNRKYNLNINTVSIIKQWNDIWNCKGNNMCECIANEPSLQNIKAGSTIQFNSQHRFFQDDIPFGLCYIKYVAQKIGVKTPFIDRVIMWAQKVMKVMYMDDDGKLIEEFLPKYYTDYKGVGFDATLS